MFLAGSSATSGPLCCCMPYAPIPLCTHPGRRRSASPPRPVRPSAGLTPNEIHSAYALPNAGARHQTIAIVSAYDDPHVRSDLNAYTKRFGIPACTGAERLLPRAQPVGRDLAAAAARPNRRRVPHRVLDRCRARPRRLPELFDRARRGELTRRERPVRRCRDGLPRGRADDRHELQPHGERRQFRLRRRLCEPRTRSWSRPVAIPGTGSRPPSLPRCPTSSPSVERS